jgi:7,8-dihydroneopterin aldolase/epimerase/oxygenase
MFIGFSALKIRCLVGILPSERETPQEIIVHLKISLSKIPSHDVISSTIDYSELASICEDVAKRSHHSLLETLAYEMLDVVSSRFSSVKCWIRIEKPGALPGADYAFVEVEN